MEKYSSKLSSAVSAESWPEECVHTNRKPWFRVATHLGSGENSDVFALGHRDRDSWRSDDDDGSSGSGSGSSSDAECSDTSCSHCGDGEGSMEQDDEEEGTGEEEEGEGEEEQEEEEEDEDEEEDEEGEFDNLQRQRRRRRNGDAVEADAVPSNLEEVRIFRPLKLGRSQLVVKVFDHLDEDTCFAVWDSTADKAVVVLHSELDCEDFVRKEGLAASPELYIREMPAVYARDNAVGLTAFDNESIVHLLLSDLAGDYTPHITEATDALRWRNTGYLVMERIACTLEDLLFKVCGNATSDLRRGFKNAATVERVTKEAVVSIVFQALFALAFMQDACKLKHHDLHTNNVFIKEITADTTFRGGALNDAAWFHYHLHGQDFFVPNCGLLAKIGDFGMASLDVHGKRLGRTDIALFNDNPKKWGAWSTELDGNEGYDTQLLFADTRSTCKDAFRDFQERERAQRRRRPRGRKGAAAAAAAAPTAASVAQDKDALLAFFGVVRDLSGSDRGSVTRHKKRPLVNKVSRKTTARLLSEIFGGDGGAGGAWWHGHSVVRTSRPPGVRDDAIVTLGSTTWLAAPEPADK